MVRSIEALYGQQQLVLLFEAEIPRSPFAEMWKPTDLAAELRERPEVPRRYVLGPFIGDLATLSSCRLVACGGLSGRLRVCFTPCCGRQPFTHRAFPYAT